MLELVRRERELWLGPRDQRCQHQCRRRRGCRPFGRQWRRQKHDFARHLRACAADLGNNHVSSGPDLAALPPYKVTDLGIAHVPEGRQVFPEMTVQENLEIGAYAPRAKAERSRSLELVYSIFPRAGRTAASSSPER